MANRYKQILIFPLVSSIHLFTKLFWRIFQPTTIGVRLLLLSDKKILLVNHSYLNQWFLPGGGVKAKESIQEALKREIKEEMDIDIRGKAQVLGIYSNFREYKKDYIIIFFMEIPKTIKITITPQNLEIRDIRYFSFENLPSNISPGTRRRIQEFLNRSPGEILVKEW